MLMLAQYTDERNQPHTQARIGLSFGHIWPQPAAKHWLQVAWGGSYIGVRSTDTADHARTPSARGVVRGFSSQSRRRLITKLSKLDRRVMQQQPLFLTLTYPADWPDDFAVWKQHIAAMRKRLLRRYPRASLIWRLEFQKRGAPHFHILLFGVPFVPHAWLARAWYDIVGSGDDRHLAAGTEVRHSRSWRQTMHYVSKYLAKTDLELDSQPVGRYWAICGEQYLATSVTITQLNYQAFDAIRSEILTRLAKGGIAVEPRSQHAGCWCLIDPSEFVKLLCDAQQRAYI